MAKAKARKKKLARRDILPADTPLQFDSPESSSVKAATYDPGQQVLQVTLRGDARYAYAGVTGTMWMEFLEARSKGHYFATVIRPMFNGTPVK